MIKLISSKAASILCKDDDNETVELYEYAIYITLSGLFHVLTVLVLGMCFNMIVESLVFYGSFVSIRKFAGGYHAKTPSRCYLFSVFVSTMILCLIKTVYYFYSLNLVISLIIIELICTLLIYVVAPLESDNKPLDDDEITIYKKIVRWIVVLFFISSTVFACFEVKFICIPMIFGVYMCGCVVVMRKIQMIRRDKI